MHLSYVPTVLIITTKTVRERTRYTALMRLLFHNRVVLSASPPHFDPLETGFAPEL